MQDRVVVVSGAGSGIGKALAIGFGKDGAVVAAIDLDVGSAQATVDEVAAAGGRGAAFAVDVRDKQSVESATARVQAEFGGIDVLINNAGVITMQSVLQLEERDWDFVLDTNLKGTLFMSQCFAPLMMSRAGASIINMSSIAATTARTDYAHYGASKAAINHLTRTFAITLSQYGIRVNAIQPGTIHTPMNAEALSDPDVLAERLRIIPLGRIGTTDDVLAAARFLASDDASYITGAILPVDGGVPLR